MRRILITAVTSLFLALAPIALASTTWYVDGVNGSDSNSCTSSQSACKTIGHAISLAASGDSIMVASATYAENLTIGFSLNVIGSGAGTTIIDGGRAGRVIAIDAPRVTLSEITIRNGSSASGAGIYNHNGRLTINYSTVTGNVASLAALGGGILNTGTLTINNSTVSGNQAVGRSSPGYGGGIYNWDGFVTINNSTISGNVAFCGVFACGAGAGGGIYNRGELHVNNSTIASNNAMGHSYPVADSQGGGIYGGGLMIISNSTISGNSAHRGGGIFGGSTLQNSILANNGGGNCYSTGSSGYNLSSDATCSFNGTGDLNSTDPKLGTLGSYGGPTQTIPLLSGSPAIDAGNPNGCTDGSGNLLKTDQRGMPRPDKEDSVGCDMGAYESQND